MKTGTFLLWQIIVLSLVLIFGTSPALAGVFHVDDSEGLLDVLITAAANGEDDTIYLAAGTYASPAYTYFPYASEEGRSLTIQGELGTSPEDVVLSGRGSHGILFINETAPWVSPLPAPDLLPELSLIGLTFTNSDSENYDPIMINASQANVIVQNCRIIDNINRQGLGGGIAIKVPYGNVTFENNLVENNQLYEREVTTGSDEAPRLETLCMGGGVYIHTSGEGIILRNNLIANNTAHGEFGIGGGLYLSGSCPTFIAFNLINNTIADNSAGFMAGGLFIKHWAGDSPANLYNNIIYGNEAPDSPVTADFWADVIGVSEIYAVHNIMSLDPEVVDLFNPPLGSFGNFDSDPEFVAGSYLPDVGSPAIDAGISLVPPPGLPETDFLNNPRVCGDAPDLGAYEICGGGWPGFPRPMISLGSTSLVMIARRKFPLPIMIALHTPLPFNQQQVDTGSWPISFAEETTENQVEWWIFLKKAGGAGIPTNSWYLGSNGWTNQAQPYGVAPASKYLLEETQIGSLCPADLGLKRGLYELWFGVDQEVDGKINPSSFTSRGMYIKLDGNPRYPHPPPQRPEWAGYPAILNRAPKVNK